MSIHLSRELVEEIKVALEQCPNPASVHATMAHYASHLVKMHRSRDRYFQTMRVQINNLADYRIKMMREHGFKTEADMRQSFSERSK